MKCKEEFHSPPMSVCLLKRQHRLQLADLNFKRESRGEQSREQRRQRANGKAGGKGKKAIYAFSLIGHEGVLYVCKSGEGRRGAFKEGLKPMKFGQTPFKGDRRSGQKKGVRCPRKEGERNIWC